MTFRFLILVWMLLPAALRGQVELRDITVTPQTDGATVAFLVSGPVRTVVVEPLPDGLAQIRMKPIAAGPAALGSPLVKPGVRSVSAHIERVDVLVTNVVFRRLVESMRVIQRDSDRVVVHVLLAPTAAPLPADLKGTTPPTSSRARTPDRNSPTTGGSGSSAQKEREAARKRWSLTTIVLDPGHGGKDPGAIGIDDLKEKDITLSVALKLRAEIRKQLPGVKVVMTRDDDTFVELFRRGQIANQAEGKLFLSIHCNSMPDKPHPASGFECYILRPGKSADAARVAAAENEAISYETDRERYDAAAVENAIMASMAQSAFARYSEVLAGAIRRSVRSTLTLPDRGVHQAGFYVLVGASMPAALLEIGYLSNEEDASILGSEAGQNRIAKTICAGLKTYARHYAASLKR